MPLTIRSNFLCKKIDLRTLKKERTKDQNLVDEILLLPEFSAKESEGVHRYLHYKFEDNEGVAEGDISITKLKNGLAFCI